LDENFASQIPADTQGTDQGQLDREPEVQAHTEGVYGGKYLKHSLKFGNYNSIRQLIVDISERRGLGDLLAESSRAAEQLPPEAGDYLTEIKGLPQSDPHDPRYIKSFALGLAVASRGADHLRNRPTLDILGLPKELTTKIYGSEVNPDPTVYETKEHVVYFSENIFAVVDCLGVCKFICHGFNSPHLLKYEQFAGLIEAVTGWQVDVGELEAVGKRVVDLERMLNQRLGLSKADDTLPKRYFTEPMPDGTTKGHRILQEEFTSLLERYYTLRHWDGDGQVSSERRAEIEREVVL
ncbi:MAG TPA: aldehyde ferredoxin oxidoreductase C-terminal domain-containing protein, partial [Verrucomicrobiae bacterium]|nr:aldehyde ferredoxin oxidoreductase C-terminal domain-containing protein [Verrucomicrobiae bacterium]